MPLLRTFLSDNPHLVPVDFLQQVVHLRFRFRKRPCRCFRRSVIRKKLLNSSLLADLFSLLLNKFMLLQSNIEKERNEMKPDIFETESETVPVA